MSNRTSNQTAPRRNIFDSIVVSLDRNIRGVQYGIYSVGIAGLLIALRSVRPFKKFGTVRDIPASFFTKHMSLNGKVVSVDSTTNPATLHIEHQPIINWKWLQPLKTRQTLPVQPSSISFTTNGFSWVHHTLKEKDITFTLLKADPGAVSAIIHYSMGKQKYGIANELLTLGFASVAPMDYELIDDPVYQAYYKHLLAAEDKAGKRGVGMWQGEGTVAYKLYERLLYGAKRLKRESMENKLSEKINDLMFFRVRKTMYLKPIK